MTDLSATFALPIARIRARLDRPIVLVGMMASGKTTFGRRLAQVLDLSFHDTDAEIEAQERCSIAEIFNDRGEPAFRALESAVIARRLTPGGKAFIVSTGGGAVMSPDNDALIFGQTISIWVRASVPFILKRLAGQPDRPLLKAGNPEKILLDLAAARYPVYGRADITVDSDGRSHDEMLPEILSTLDQRLTA